ncbi:MAG: hypothetical protein KKF95_07025 [Nanoarchaeota archaeon]|nr:hypothetical protein [Nanoarchaeota archaeon]MBU2443797.1 hypothetical protein [Nanoarchaeota archaeon]
MKEVLDWMRLILVAVILLLAMPMAIAMDVSKIEFLSIGKPITTISTTNEIRYLDFRITVTGEDFESLQADISEIHRNVYFVQTNSYKTKAPTSCEKQSDNTTFICYLRTLTLWLSNSTVKIPITLYNTSGATTIVNKTFTFTIDNTRPSIVSIKTDKCTQNNTCYIASGKGTSIIIQFQDSMATFNNEKVRYSFAGKNNILVKNCTGMTCYGNSVTTCASGQEIPIRISTMDAMDDAFNKVNKTFTSSFICDNSAPSIVNLTITTNTFDKITSDSNVDVKIIVKDDISPSVSAKANLSGVGINSTSTASCDKNNETFTCKFSFKVSWPGYYTTDLKFSISDLAGNILAIAQPIEVLAVENQSVNLWSVVSSETSPKQAPAKELQHSTWQIYQYINMRPSVSGQELVSVKKKSCDRKNNDTTAVLDATILSFKDKIIVMYTVPKGVYKYTTLEYNCTFELYTKKGESLTKIPELESVYVSLQLLNTAGSEEKVVQEITRLKEKIEARQESYNSWFNTLKTVYTVAGYICPIPGLAYGVGAVFGISQTVSAVGSIAADLIPGGQGVATSLKQVASSSDKSNKQFTKYGETMTSYIGTACGVLTCKSPWLTSLVSDNINKIPALGDLNKITADYAKMMGLNNSFDLMDEYKSLPIAIIKTCPPALLYHYMRGTSIECNYLNCIQSRASQGLNLAWCQSMKNYEECVYSTGSVFHSMPILPIVNNVGKMLEQVAKDPYSAGLAAATTFLCKQDAPSPDSRWNYIFYGACSVPKLLENVNKVLNIVGFNKQIKERQFGQRLENPEQKMCQSIIENTLRLTYMKDLGGVEISGANMYCDSSGCSYENKKLRYDAVLVQTIYTVQTKDAQNNDRLVIVEPNFGHDEFYDESGNLYSKYAYEGRISRHDITLSDLAKINTLTDAEIEQKFKVKASVFRNMADQVENAMKIKRGDDMKELGVSDETIKNLDNADNRLKEAIEESTKIQHERDKKNGARDSSIADYNEVIAALNKQIEDIDKELTTIITSEREQYLLKTRTESLANIIHLKKGRDNLPKTYDEEAVKAADEEVEKAEQEWKYYHKNVMEEMQYGNLDSEGLLKGLTHLTLGFARTMGLYSGVFARTGILDTTEVIFKFLEPIYEFFSIDAFVEKQLCDSNFEEVGGSFVLTRLNSGEITPGAFVAGSKSLINKPDGTSVKKYFVYGQIINAKKDGLKFKIYMTGGGTHVINETVTLNKGQMFPSSGSPLDRPWFEGNLTGDYNEACIEFKTSYLNEYFDVANVDDNKICAPLVVLS